MVPISVMQGRLTPSLGRGVQFFPAGPGEWEQEFELASAAGISSIEWVGTPDSPLFDPAGQAAVRAVVARTGVTLRNMDLHEMLTKNAISDDAEGLFEKICSGLKAVEGGVVEMPLLEASSLLPKETYTARVSTLKRFLTIAKKHNTPVAIETDLDPFALKAFLEDVPEVTVAYDSGNSAGFGYDVSEEIAAYGTRISNVHIKDKPRGGSTVPLGEGDADFSRLFSLLNKISYTGAVTLQAARGEDGREVETIAQYVGFIRERWEAAFHS